MATKGKVQFGWRRLISVFFLCKLFIFSLSFLSNQLVVPNSTANLIFLEERSDFGEFDQIVKMAVRPFVQWDAIHFLAIAKDGYLFENQFAFFPFLPMINRLLADSIGEIGLKQYLSLEGRIALSGIFLGNLCHLLAVIFLYKMSIAVFKKKEFAFRTALFYILNPAAVQLTAMYTEAPFAMFTFLGLHFYYQRAPKILVALSWALAGTVRSNGLVMIGFFWYDLWNDVMIEAVKMSFCKFCFKFIANLVYSLISLSGFIGFQMYGYFSFCVSEAGGVTRPWCSSSPPLLYNFVQKHYWNVGFLKYFTLLQLPNFLLAAPMIIISISAIISYFNADPLRFLSIGILKERKKKPASQPSFTECDQLLPHIYLLIFMVFYNVLVAHVQTITRVFTFLPIVYWYMATIVTMSEKHRSSIISPKKWLLGYVGLYGLLGIVLFSTHYPPA